MVLSCAQMACAICLIKKCLRSIKCTYYISNQSNLNWNIIAVFKIAVKTYKGKKKDDTVWTRVWGHRNWHRSFLLTSRSLDVVLWQDQHRLSGNWKLWAMEFRKGLHSLWQKSSKFHGHGNINTASRLVLGVYSQHWLEIALFQALSLLFYWGWGYGWNKLCCHRIKLVMDQGFEKGKERQQEGLSCRVVGEKRSASS